MKYLITILMLITINVNAAEVTVKDKVLFFDGEIRPGDYKKVIEAFNNNPIDEIYLNSGGGYLRVAINIGYFINALGIKTVIAKDTECASACGLIFLAGKTRQFDGKLGIHCSYIKDTEGCYMPGVDKMESFLKDIKLSDKTVAFYIENAQQRKMKWFVNKK